MLQNCGNEAGNLGHKVCSGMPLFLHEHVLLPALASVCYLHGGQSHCRHVCIQDAMLGDSRFQNVNSVDGDLTYSSYWLHRPAVLTRLNASLAEDARRRRVFLHPLQARKCLLQS